MNIVTNHLFRLVHQHFDIEYLCLTDGKSERWKLDALRRYASISAIQRPNRRSFGHRLLYAGLIRLRQQWSYIPSEVFYEVPPVLKAAVRQKLSTGDYDLLFMEYWYFGELGDWLGQFNVAALLHDDEMARIESEIPATRPSARIALRRKVEFVFQSHLALMRRARNVFFISAEDQQSFFKRAGASFPNARVFPCYYEYGELPTVERRQDMVIFSGKMSYLPNVLAARRLAVDIWPAVRARFPRAKLLLAGGHPTAEVNKLAEIPGVEVTGFVEDLRGLVASAAVFVAPIEIGGGLKIKLMEAAELESAIVATPFAFRGFEVEHDHDFLAAQTDSEFAHSIIRLLSFPDERVVLGKNAREAVFRQFSSEAIKTKVIALFEELTSSERSTSRVPEQCRSRS